MPRLLTVSGKYLDLEPGCTYILGRGSVCDIVVEDCSCSRRHAQITMNEAGDLAYVEDLGSRNGTFLNGRQTRDVTLVGNGDQIRVGSTIFVLYYDDDEGRGSEEVVETRAVYTNETLLLEAGSSVPQASISGDNAISGHLGRISLPEVLQLLIQGRRCGTLRLDFHDVSGSIDIDRGEIRAAAIQERRGMEALCVIGSRRDGRFRFAEHEGPFRREIARPSHEVLFELCRTLDESTVLDEEV